MNKKVIIASLIALLLFIGLFFWLFSSKKPATPGSSAPADNSASNIMNTTEKTLFNKAISPFNYPAKSSDKMTIRATTGDVNIANLYINPIENLSQNGVTFAQNSNYSMEFYPQDQGFLIILSNPDFATGRKNAESDLLSRLGIAEDQACKLKVSITIPVSVNAEFGGGVYGLSFCNNK